MGKNRRLDSLGITEGVKIFCVVSLRQAHAQRCPVCSRDNAVRRGVTIGGSHEGWGRRWNLCNYDCMHCRMPISQGLEVNACNACKCFWHKSCRVASEGAQRRGQAWEPCQTREQHNKTSQASQRPGKTSVAEHVTSRKAEKKTNILVEI